MGVSRMTKWSKPLGIASASAAVMGTLTILSPSVAKAYNVGATGATACGALNITANYDSTEVVYYYRSGLVTANYNAVAWSMSSNVDPTDLSSSSVGSSGAATVVYYDDAYTDYCGRDWYSGGGGTVGYTKCDYLEGAACGKHSIKFDTGFTAAIGITHQRGLACHETGHALGFEHPPSWEMQSSCLADSSKYTGYSSDEINAINFIYW